MPTNLGKYAILGQLGKGAMGVVYRSIDPIIKRPVALKTIRKELLTDEEKAANLSARFRNEAQAAGRLLHPGIVAIYEYGEDEEFAFIAMEYVEGSSLREFFERGTHFEQSDVVDVMIQLLEALQYAHEQGVWHRDIKPGNIIIMSNGRVKVADFGIARVDSSTTLTRDGAVLGTPGFIAPEQYLGGQIDGRVDLFAAGVVFYKLLTGMLPFSGSTESVIYKVCYESASPPSIVTGNPDLARFDAIARRALAKSPEDRYASAHEFRGDLLAAYAQPVSLTIAEETLRGDAATSTAGWDVSTLAGGAPVGWPADKLGAIERSLIDFLGPIGRIIVRDAAREARDLAGLLQILARYLPLADRDTFLRQIDSPLGVEAARAPTPQFLHNDSTEIRDAPGLHPLTPDEIARATRLLIDYLGPFAKVIVQEAAQSGVSRSAFLARISQTLKESEKRHFLNDFEQANRS